jgi:large subunit ribosomal protein L22
MEAKAIEKSIRISPIKARLVIDLIRGKNVDEALNILNNKDKKTSKFAVKALESAIANAVNNNKMDRSKLFVKEARVDAGPVMKRIMFDSRGYIGHKDKRTSHIVVRVKER